MTPKQKLDLALSAWMTEYNAAEARGEYSEKATKLAHDVNKAFNEWLCK